MIFWRTIQVNCEAMSGSVFSYRSGRPDRRPDHVQISVQIASRSAIWVPDQSQIAPRSESDCIQIDDLISDLTGDLINDLIGDLINDLTGDLINGLTGDLIDDSLVLLLRLQNLRQ